MRWRMPLGIGLLAFSTVLGVPALAHAERPALAAAVAAEGDTGQQQAYYSTQGPLGSYQTHWEATVGVRTAFVTDGGFDPYATDNALIQLSVGGGRTLLSQGRFSLAVMGLWDYGERQATARGERTQLDVHRISIGPEARYHVIPRFFVFLRTSPSAIYTAAQLDESITAVSLYSHKWVAGFDGTAGAAFEVIGKKSGESRKPRFWVVGEGGYSWAAPADVNLRPASDNASAPQRVAPVQLPTLLLRGPMFRVSVALTF